MNDLIKFLISSLKHSIKMNECSNEYHYTENLNIIADLIQRNQYQTALHIIKDELKFSFYDENISETQLTDMLYKAVKEEYKAYLTKEQQFSNIMLSEILKNKNINPPCNKNFLIENEQYISDFINKLEQSTVENKEAIIVMAKLILDQHLSLEKIK